MKLLFLLPLLASCATNLAGDPSKMDAAQLKEWVRDKNANISCGVFSSPYGRTVMTYVVLDKGIIMNGTVSVDNECKVTFANTKPEIPRDEVITIPPNCRRSGNAIVCDSIVR